MVERCLEAAGVGGSNPPRPILRNVYELQTVRQLSQETTLERRVSPYRLVARTSDSQSDDAGSSPARGVGE